MTGGGNNLEQRSKTDKQALYGIAAQSKKPLRTSEVAYVHLGVDVWVIVRIDPSL